jgi:hypothetical protein
MSKIAAVTPLSRVAASREGAALVFLVATTVVAVVAVPLASWRASPVDPCHVGVLGGIACTAALTVTRFAGEGGIVFERLIAAVFLFVMPLIYVGSFLLWHSGGSFAPWLYVELAAVPLYGALAVAGFRGRPALLAIGIAAHGIGWDLWHFGQSSYIPDWYAFGCLSLDIAMALFIAARMPRWRAAAARK